MAKSLKDFIGVDASLETSLFEYGFICRKYSKDSREDEYWCLYKQGDKFANGYLCEEFLNNLVNEKEWMDWKDVDSFFSFTGGNLEEWLELPFVYKLSDLLAFSGSENIFGTEYYPVTEQTIRELYKF